MSMPHRYHIGFKDKSHLHYTAKQRMQFNGDCYDSYTNKYLTIALSRGSHYDAYYLQLVRHIGWNMDLLQ